MCFPEVPFPLLWNRQELDVEPSLSNTLESLYNTLTLSMRQDATPPEPEGLPFLGNAFPFSRNPVAAMENWATLGDVVHIKAPGQSIYMVTDPELIEQILVDQEGKFTIGPAQRETFRGVEDHAVTMTTGEQWKRLRRALNPAFTREAIKTYSDRIATTTARYIDKWEDGEQIELNREMRLLAVQILADALLDVDVRGREDIVMSAADALVDRANFRRPGLLLPDWIPTPTDIRFRRAVQALDAFVDDIITERRGSGSTDDVCSILLDAHDAGALSLEEVRHNLVALLLAGHESPSATLTYAWFLLSDHPAVRKALVDEHREVIDGQRPIGDSVEHLEATRNVVSETLRLYPPTTGVNRQAMEPVTLGEYELPEGAQFLIPQWVVHRDERYWDDPKTFDPSRWKRPTDRPTYAYFPFSGGPRNCVGAAFAREELTIALTTMAGRVDLDVTADKPLRFTPSVQLRPETDFEATVSYL